MRDLEPVLVCFEDREDMPIEFPRVPCLGEHLEIDFTHFKVVEVSWPIAYGSRLVGDYRDPDQLIDFKVPYATRPVISVVEDKDD